MPKNPTLYPESTILSYPTARPSRDLIVAEQAGEEHWTGDFIFENGVADRPYQKRSGTKTENAISRVQSGEVQDSGKSDGHLRQ